MRTLLLLSSKCLVLLQCTRSLDSSQRIMPAHHLWLVLVHGIELCLHAVIIFFINEQCFLISAITWPSLYCTVWLHIVICYYSVMWSQDRHVIIKTLLSFPYLKSWPVWCLGLPISDKNREVVYYTWGNWIVTIWRKLLNRWTRNMWWKLWR